MTLIEHLISLGNSKKEAQRFLKNGKVFLCGIPTSDGKRIIDPKDVSIRVRAPKMVPGRDPSIVHKDNGFVVVYKPANFLSVRASHRHKDPNIMGFVHRICKAAYAVHRLDEETSGLMIVATDEKTQIILKKALERRSVTRIYLALASGNVKAPFTAKSILVRNRGDGKRGSQKNNEAGKQATTHITPIEKLVGATLVQAKLETGRTHQIRIHLNEHRNPVLGDPLYAPKSVQFKAKRLALHAHTLSFKHPHTRKKLSFTAPLADDLEQLRRGLLIKS
jgi:23S rRNA pseudouridine1911/1915/1917 synthase